MYTYTQICDTYDIHMKYICAYICRRYVDMIYTYKKEIKHVNINTGSVRIWGGITYQLYL